MKTGAAGLVEWIKLRQPYLYRRVARQLEKLAASPLADDVTPAPTWSDTLKNLVTVAGQAMLSKSQLDAQQKILDLQISRAKAGLAPLDIDPTTFGITGPQVTVGLDPSTKNLALIVGGILAAVYLLPKLRGR
jgi:hypothetical protein